MDKYISLKEYAQVRFSTAGDIFIMALCMVMYILFYQSYITHNHMISRIRRAVAYSYFAVTMRLIFYEVIIHAPGQHLLIYSLRIAYYVLIISCVLIYAMYIQEVMRVAKSEKNKIGFMIFAQALSTIAVILDIVFSYIHIGFYITKDNTVHNISGNPYMILLVLFYSGIIYNIVTSIQRTTNKIRIGLLMTTALSVLIIVMQNFFGNESCTLIAVFLPIIAVIFLFHTGAYNMSTGMAGGDVFYNELGNVIKANKTCLVFAIYSHNFAMLMKTSQEFKRKYVEFYTHAVRNGMICQIDTERYALLYRKNNHTNVGAITQNLKSGFDTYFRDTKLDYKIMTYETDPRITEPSDYKSIMRIHEKLATEGEVHHIAREDFDSFIRRKYILGELNDINLKKDLNDKRVLVYCQPVLNITTNEYDTAEILMRLELDEYGIIYPDQFIPAAEENNIIHTLTLIILNKTCAYIRDMLEKGYNINRFSVNFSVQDFNKPELCDEVISIMNDNKVPFEKIAIEITESKLISNFDKLKPRILFFHEQGMKFYLDDFGTGYSNFERIMELPFNIIKFDRSLVIESQKNSSNYYMIKTFSEMFRNLSYDVLFEGVEDEKNEANCIDMKATYLQGYKYSKPIPIARLTEFLKAPEKV